MTNHKLNKRKLIVTERLGTRTLTLIAGMAIAAGIVAGDVTSAGAAARTESSVTETALPSTPGTIVLTPSVTKGEQTAYHQSHYSHRSHMSHYSHYSGR